MSRSPGVAFGALLAAALVGVLLLPIVALALSATPAQIGAGLADPSFGPALWLSLRTTLVALAIILLAGTPLAWWLATSRSRLASVLSVLVDLPIVIPPAVVGVALLQTFGRQGLLGPTLESLGLTVPFTPTAVVLAQVVVSAPFYVQAATSAFGAIDADLRIVARSLGASPTATFLRVALPMAAPGLIGGASLAWARALGEFGATLLFAGNMSGRTQTLPLAIFTALEQDVQLAVVFSLVLVAVGALLLVGLRWLPGRRAS